MNPEERRERGTLLCGRLSRDVAKIAPEGLGTWNQTWSIVGPSDARFVLALARWEATGHDADKPPLRQAYSAVLDAWKCAAAAFTNTQGERP